MNVDPLLKPLESLLNRNLGASTPGRQLLAELAGRSFALEVIAPLPGARLRVRLGAETTGLAVTSGDEPADATVSGTPFALAALVSGRASGVAASGATISGDAEVAQAFEKLLRHARPDLEEELARLVGDVPARQAARAARGFAEWGRTVADTFVRNVGEYLQEEGRDVPARAEAEQFYADVDRTREDADRAEARLRLLEARVRGATGAPDVPPRTTAPGA
ncbi:MAG: SCP2 sterol-binding domain-containing protein [Steroidobacteraceae bacterium]|jgi:ubiquinone biosynthesis protein UbiJ|nr:SCP2 sterol-binding domain-containing protein [Steroidobacteraceae bacterium]